MREEWGPLWASLRRAVTTFLNADTRDNGSYGTLYRKARRTPTRVPTLPPHHPRPYRRARPAPQVIHNLYTRVLLGFFKPVVSLCCTSRTTRAAILPSCSARK